jgi:hypothetical protein
MFALQWDWKDLMPPYPAPAAPAVLPPPPLVCPGDQGFPILSVETLGAGIFSQRVAILDRAHSLRPVLVSFFYSDSGGVNVVVPGAVQYDIYGAMEDLLPGHYTKIGSTTNTAGDQVTIQRSAAGGPQFRFILVKEVITPTNAALATVKVFQ